MLIVSLGSTTGLRLADEALADSLRRAGASVSLAQARPPGEVRTLMATDLQWARAARRAALEQLDRKPRAIVYSTTTAALLWPRPGAIRFDAPAAGNRPGWDGLWQRPVERRRLSAASILLPLSQGGLREARLPAEVERRALVLPLPVEPSGPPRAGRDIAAITYAGNPAKKGLTKVLEAWRRVRARGTPEAMSDELLVAGASEHELRAAGIEIAAEQGVRSVGRLPVQDYRELLRRARVFVCAPRREDYGAAQLEALADGCLLASTPAPGPYAALPIALSLDERLIDEDLASALGRALEHPDRLGYASRARQALAPFSPEAIDGRVAAELLPRLLDGAP